MYNRSLFEIGKIAKISMEIEKEILRQQELESNKRKNEIALKYDKLAQYIDFCVKHANTPETKQIALECQKTYISDGGLPYGKLLFVYSFVVEKLWEQKNEQD